MEYKTSEKQREARKKYYIKNKEREQARNKDYWQKNKESLHRFQKKYTSSHKEERKKYWDDYYKNNKYYILRKNADNNKRYQKESPERFVAKTNRRRALKKNCPINDLTLHQWRDLKRTFDNHCAYCGKKCDKMHQEHMTPLSRGGNHTLSNIVPSCSLCNSRKGTKTVEEFYEVYGENLIFFSPRKM